MGKLESALKTEIVRLARREAKASQRPVSREVVRLKKKIAEMRRTIVLLRKEIKLGATRPSGVSDLTTATEEELRKARFSPTLIQKLRKRLGITQSDLATLLGVTPGAVAFWEQGRSRPRDSHKRKIITLRKLGKRDVAKLLSQPTATAKPKPSAPPRRKKAAKKKKRRGKVATRKRG